MTKQYRDNNIANGNCGQCGRKRNLYKRLCDVCADKHTHNERMRRGFKEWKSGSKGRTPIDMREAREVINDN